MEPLSEELFAINREIRRKVWDGALPLKIDIEYSDISSIEPPRSFYVLAPRLNYLFSFLKELKEHFDEYAPPNALENYEDMWFEYNKVPLKWNTPLGVLYDTLVGSAQDADLPWCITFHYRGFPEDKILAMSGLNFIKYSYINALKESTVLRTGSATAILSNMSKKDETRMLDGMLQHNFDAFWEINAPLCDKEVGELKAIAVRIYSNKYHTFVQYPAESQKELTVGAYLVRALPRLFRSEGDQVIGPESC